MINTSPNRAYLALCLQHSVQIQPKAGLQVRPERYANTRTAFTNEDLIAEGDRVVSRFTIRGTHKGVLMGIAPTNKPVTVTGIVIYRIVDGKVVEQWENINFLGMMQQLGVFPPPGKAEK